MTAIQQLRAVGQSLWLDHITRELLDTGGLRRYIDDFAITGLTSNPTIFDGAIAAGSAYDASIRDPANARLSSEELFLKLALEDLRRAADLFSATHAASDRLDGWVSMEISPLLANAAEPSITAARQLHHRAGRSNLLVKVPGTPAGLVAIESLVTQGVPINVTLLFSREQYQAATEAYLRGIESRLERGLDPQVGSVASVFVSRWDKATADRVPDELRNRLGIAVAQCTYHAYRRLLDSPRWHRLAAAGAKPQRLLWASTGTKDPTASDTLYVDALAASDTINTMPEKTLLAFADHGRIDTVLAADGGGCEPMLARFANAGIDVQALASQLQRDGAEAFVASWKRLLERIDKRRSPP